jgi:hypothetical protein
MGDRAAKGHYRKLVMKLLLLALALACCVDAHAQAARPAQDPGPKTAAPVLPFRYIGRLFQQGKREVLLMRGEQLFSITTGDRIGDDYLVDHVGDSSISFTYLPLKMKQHLLLPGLNQ